MFGRNASAQQQNAKVYFLAVNGSDPGDAFIIRFAASTPPVKRRSECIESAFVGVCDRATGELGLIFEIGAIRWQSESMVEVDGGYYEDGLSGSGNTYYVERRGGRWEVVKDVMHWIS
jgi:hypothetical protein